MTTARKAVTLLLSYVIFTKPLTEQHATGLLLMGMGIVLKMVPENKPSPSRRSTTVSSDGGQKSERSSRRGGETELPGTGDAGEEETRPLV